MLRCRRSENDLGPGVPARSSPAGAVARHHRPHGGQRGGYPPGYGAPRAWLSAGPAEPARRVGRVRLPADAAIDDALDHALRATELEVVEVHFPTWKAATTAAMTVLGAEAWQVHAELWRRHADELSADVSQRLKTSASISALELEAARQEAVHWQAELAAVFRQVELIALPTLAAAPPLLEDADRLTQLRHVAPFNLAGVPALSLPVVGTAPQLPIPASLSSAGPGPAWSEELLVATGGGRRRGSRISALT